MLAKSELMLLLSSVEYQYFLFIEKNAD